MRMSDETYYTVLNVKESASSAEIKTAYRDLIKQVHPDTKANLAPYLKKIAEDKTKEVIEAYTVLSNFSKRRDYDRQLVDYRRHTMPQARPAPQPTRRPTTPTASFCYCNRCRIVLRACRYCPKCGKLTTPAAARSASPPRPQAIRWLGCNWAPLICLSREQPRLVVVAVLFSVIYFGAFIRSHFPDLNASQSSATTSQMPTPPLGLIVDEKATGTESPTPTVSDSGTWVGTLHNRTANLSSPFTVVIHRKANGLLYGCVEDGLPHGSGALRGSIRGSRVKFDVANIKFEGDVSNSGIAGKFVVIRQEGSELGDFRLTNLTVDSNTSYYCAEGEVTISTE